MEFIKNIDTELFLFLNGLHNSFFDFLMYWLSNRLIWIPAYLFIIYLIIKRFKTKNGIFLILTLIAAVAISDQISVHFFKNVFLRYRPCHNLDIKHIVHLVNDRCGGQYGFVSSHASNFFTLASFVSLIFNKKRVSFIMFFWAIAVSYSRIYLGVHYPLDILGGALLGTIIGFLSFVLVKKYLKLYND